MTRLEYYINELKVRQHCCMFILNFLIFFKKIEIETDSQNPDFEPLREAISQLQGVLNSISLAHNAHSNVEKILQIKKSLQGFQVRKKNLLICILIKEKLGRIGYPRKKIHKGRRIDSFIANFFRTTHFLLIFVFRYSSFNKEKIQRI